MSHPAEFHKNILLRPGSATFLVLLVVIAITLAPATHAMKWKKLTNQEIIAAADLVIEGQIERVVSAAGAVPHEVATKPRDPAQGSRTDAAAIIQVKVIQIFKGRPEKGFVSVIYWSDFGDRDKTHFSKYQAPRRLRQDQRMILALKKNNPKAFLGFLAPLEAPATSWTFAFDAYYDPQIQSPAFAAAAQSAK
jgi:hypothetical protein